MAFSKLNIGQVPDDGTGDTPHGGGQKINDNFDAILKPTRSTNLFDKFTATDGYKLIYGNNGVPVADPLWWITDFYPVKAGETYTISASALARSVIFYDEAQENSVFATTQVSTFTVPSTAGIAWMRIATRYTDATPESFMMVKGGALPNAYEWYHGYDMERMDNKDQPNGYAGLDESRQLSLAVLPAESPNLFNPATATMGVAISSGATVANADFFSTDYIRVEPNTTYSNTPPTDGLGKNYSFYDDGKAYIAGSSITSMGQFTSPANARYVRGCARIAQNPVDLFMIVEGAALPASYKPWQGLSLERMGNKDQPNGYAGLDESGRLRSNVLPDQTASPLAGKIIAGLGDSITYGFIPRNYAGYPGQLQSYLPLIAEELGASYLNYGISGSTLGDNGSTPVANSPFSQRYDAMSNDADLVIVMGGTNDCRKNVPLGVFGDTTDKTFFGALYVLCQGLLQKYRYTPGTTVGATKKIMFMTALKLLKASMPDGLDDLLPSYNEATKQVCAFFSIPVFDAYNLSGLTPHLFRTLQGTETGYTDVYNPYQTDGIHPTQEGNQIFAKTIAGFIRGLY